MKRVVLFAVAVWSIFACSETFKGDQRMPAGQAMVASQVFQESTAKLDSYWYKGLAEISSYELIQNRYRDEHPGEAIMIFVTEDFLTDKQVKNDNYTNPNSISILKNNMVRKFPTGVYDYSMMTSVFTPANPNQYPHTLKVTTSSQEWCGHTFMQINKHKENFSIQLNSYFESEGDQQLEAPIAILEDELYNRIRINPDNLPSGSINIYPSTMVLRLMHLPFEPVKANCALMEYEGEDFEGNELKAYTVQYPALNRQLTIVFESEAPYEIVGWKDTYPSAFDKKIRTTSAKRKKTILSPYWQKNSLLDMSLRAELELD